MKIITKNEDETYELGRHLGSILGNQMVILLEGELGAGKTLFTKGIAKGLGIKATVNSPSFLIMKEYENKLYHLDLYRLDDIGTDFDLEEYVNSDAIIVIEWPFRISKLIPKTYLLVKIEYLDDTTRSLEFISKGEKEEKTLLEFINDGK